MVGSASTPADIISTPHMLIFPVFAIDWSCWGSRSLAMVCAMRSIRRAMTERCQPRRAGARFDTLRDRSIMAIASTDSTAASRRETNGPPVLEVQHLQTHFFTRNGSFPQSTTCRSVSAQVETLGSSANRAAQECDLAQHHAAHPHPPGKIVGGRILLVWATPSRIWCSWTMQRCARCAAMTSP